MSILRIAPIPHAHTADLALYTYVLSQRLALTRLRSKTQKLEAELVQLHNILDELTKGYNPNYQDMAVKAAVVGYTELTAIAGAGESAAEGDQGQEVKPDTEAVEDITDRELDDLDRKDLEGLLLSEDVEEDDDDGEGGICECNLTRACAKLRAHCRW